MVFDSYTFLTIVVTQSWLKITCHIFGIDLTGRDSSVSEIGIVSDNGVYWLCEKNRCSWNITVKPMYLLFNTVSVIQNATQNIFPTISTCSRLQKTCLPIGPFRLPDTVAPGFTNTVNKMSQHTGCEEKSTEVLFHCYTRSARNFEEYVFYFPTANTFCVRGTTFATATCTPLLRTHVLPISNMRQGSKLCFWLSRWLLMPLGQCGVQRIWIQIHVIQQNQ